MNKNNNDLIEVMESILIHKHHLNEILIPKFSTKEIETKEEKIEYWMNGTGCSYEDCIAFVEWLEKHLPE